MSSATAIASTPRASSSCKPAEELIQGTLRPVCSVQTLSARRGQPQKSFLNVKGFSVPEKYINVSWSYQCPSGATPYFKVDLFVVTKDGGYSGFPLITEDGQSNDFGRTRFRLSNLGAKGKKIYFFVEVANSYLRLFNFPGKPYFCSWQLRVTADNYPVTNLWKTPPRDYPNDRLFTYQWPLQNVGQFDGTPGADIKVLDAWKITECSPNLVIAVVDSGVARLPDLRSKLVPGASFDRHLAPTRDDVGHGTAVASVAAAATNNEKGMAGVCPLGRIMPVKIHFEGTAAAARQTTARGIRWAVNHGARIINLSLGFKKDYPGMREAVAYAYQRNVLVVAASGNSGHLSHTYPQSYPHVLLAGGSTRRDERWGFSSYGPKDLVLAPSQEVLIPVGGSRFENADGTSVAAPEVAGLAGLILSIRPDLTVDQVVSAIEQGADPVQGQTGYNLKDGYGRIDCYRSLLIAQQMPRASGH